MKPIQRPRALIFDMDGLLLDSERIAMDGFLFACRELGVEPDIPTYYRCIGTTGRDSRQIMIDGHGPDFPADAVREVWGQYYDERVHHQPTPKKSGVLTLLNLAVELDVPVALATSTGEPTANRKLELAGLLHFFDTRVTGDQVTNGKPHPEPYLTAADRLGVAPGEAWAMEDSPNGVRSALGAGMTVFQVPDLVQPDDALRALGHEIVRSLDEIAERLRRSS